MNYLNVANRVTYGTDSVYVYEPPFTVTGLYSVTPNIVPLHFIILLYLYLLDEGYSIVLLSSDEHAPTFAIIVCLPLLTKFPSFSIMLAYTLAFKFVFMLTPITCLLVRVQGLWLE